MNKVHPIQFFLFAFFAVLINIYISSLGLMDDFNYTNLNFIKDPGLYLKFIFADINSGGLRPFLPFQITINNVGYLLFSNKGYFIINLLILFGILEFFYVVFNKLFSLNKFIYYILFFSWPYSYDLIIHPSLQEKFIILFLCLFVNFCIENKDKSYLKTLLSFLIPFLKIQSLIFLPFVYSVLKKYSNSKNIFTLPLISFVSSSLIVLAIFFSKRESYFNQGIDIERLISQLTTSYVNILNFVILFIAILVAKKNKNKNIYILQNFALSNILLIIFMSAYKPIDNYLNSLNIFFIIVYVLIIYQYVINLLPFRNLETFLKLFSVIFFTLIFQLFGIPRFERMNSIGDVFNYQSDIGQQTIYYSCSEGVEYLNKFQDNNTYIHVDSFQNLNQLEFLFLSDSFACNNIESLIDTNCLLDEIINFKYENSMKLKKYKC
ncbi:MAG: hypothetical protein CMD46_00040 [Gammaproteobacteria bacterium]|nr:hypothetical protein [Gammaproteobacteria bacterium]